MRLQAGYLYHIKDEFFEKINENNLMINHEKGHSRPSYLVVEENELLWFIPLSTKVDKYKKIVNKKLERYGTCRSILIRKIAKRQQVILIQNAFPTIKKYVQSRHMIEGKLVKVLPSIQEEIIDSLKYMFSLKEEGLNLFFTDIDKIKEMMLEELKMTIKN